MNWRQFFYPTTAKILTTLLLWAMFVFYVWFFYQYARYNCFQSPGSYCIVEYIARPFAVIQLPFFAFVQVMYLRIPMFAFGIKQPALLSNFSYSIVSIFYTYVVSSTIIWLFSEIRTTIIKKSHSKRTGKQQK